MNACAVRQLQLTRSDRMLEMSPGLTELFPRSGRPGIKRETIFAFPNQRWHGDFRQAGTKVAAMRILLLNLDQGSTQEVTQALSGQGYEITTGRGLSVEEILGLSPGVLITEATPSDLSCCGLISRSKAGPDPPTPKIWMISPGRVTRPTPP